MPHLVTCNSIADQLGSNCPEPPCGYLDMTSSAALGIVKEVLGEVVGLSKGGRLGALLGGTAVHLGGDELSDYCFGKTKTAPLFGAWTTALQAVAKGKGATSTTFWMEAVTKMGAKLDPTITSLQLWNDAGPAVLEALDAGYSLVYSNVSEYYLGGRLAGLNPLRVCDARLWMTCLNPQYMWMNCSCPVGDRLRCWQLAQRGQVVVRPLQVVAGGLRRRADRGLPCQVY